MAVLVVTAVQLNRFKANNKKNINRKIKIHPNKTTVNLKKT